MHQLACWLLCWIPKSRAHACVGAPNQTASGGSTSRPQYTTYDGICSPLRGTQQHQSWGGGAIVVAFRGTDSHSLYNWVENMRYWKTDYDIPYPGSEGALVHTGQFVKLHPAVSCTHCQQPPYQQSCLPKLLMCAFYGQLVVADYNTLCLTHMAWIFCTRMLASCPSQTINIARQPSLQTFYSLCKQ